MKKTLPVLLLLFVLLLCGCKPTTPPGGDNSVNPEEENDDYLQIEGRYVADYAGGHFAFRGSNAVLTLSVPADWEFTPLAEDSYAISREKNNIGYLFSGAVNASGEWVCVNQKATEVNGIEATQYIDKYGTQDTLRFQYRYTYAYTEKGSRREVTLVVDYAEVSIHTASMLFYETYADNLRKDALFDTLCDVKDGSVLLMGNSFINSSRVGSILNEMMQKNGKDTEVTAYARGFAHVDTYTNDPWVMEDIRSGQYDVIFICGLYAADEVENLRFMQEACEASDTKMVVFPAHNEPRDYIEEAKEQYPTVTFFDWKAEIDALIATGIDKWLFCVDDQHLHTTELGGYVGAHMIYRAMYGEVPTAPLYETVHEGLYSILGDYVTTGYPTPPNYDWVHFLA